MSKIVLIDTIPFKINLKEGSKKELPNGRIYVEGKAQHCNLTNKNKRRYPKEATFGRVLKEGAPFMQRLANNELFGHLEHPESGRSDLRQAAIKLEKVWMTGDEVMLGFSTLSTTLGKDGAALLRDGMTVGISSRGTGSVVAGTDGVDEVQDDYDLETWDLVADPSTPGAQMIAEAYDKLAALGEEKAAKEEAQALAEATKLEEEVPKEEKPEEPPASQVVETADDSEEEEQKEETPSADPSRSGEAGSVVPLATGRLEERPPFAGRERNTRMTLPPDLEFIEDEYPIDIQDNNIIWDTVDGFVTMDFADRDTAVAIDYAIHKKRSGLKTKLRSIPSKGIHRLRIWGNRHWSESTEEEAMNREVEEARVMSKTVLVQVSFADFRDFGVTNLAGLADLMNEVDLFADEFVEQDTGAMYLAFNQYDMKAVKKEFASAGAKLREAEMTDELAAKLAEAKKKKKPIITDFKTHAKEQYDSMTTIDGEISKLTAQMHGPTSSKHEIAFGMRPDLAAAYTKNKREALKSYGKVAVEDRGTEPWEVYLQNAAKYQVESKEESIEERRYQVVLDTAGQRDTIYVDAKDPEDAAYQASKSWYSSGVRVEPHRSGSDLYGAYTGFTLRGPGGRVASVRVYESVAEATILTKQTVIAISPDEVPGSNGDPHLAGDVIRDLLTVNNAFDVEIIVDGDVESVFVIVQANEKEVKKVLDAMGIEMSAAKTIGDDEVIEMREVAKENQKDSEEEEEDASTLAEKEKKLLNLKKEKFRADCSRHLDIEEATKQLLDNLSERNAQLQEKVEALEKDLAQLKEINEAMDDLRRREALTAEQDRLLAEHPQLEKGLHLLNKATTIDDMQRTAKELVNLLQADEQVVTEREKKEKKKKEVDKKPAPVIMETVPDAIVGSDAKGLTETFESPSARLARRHRTYQ